MASSGNHLCTLCQEDDDVDNVAVTWCTDCETFLCFDCAKHHDRNKASKEHRTLSIQDYQNLPAFIFETSNRCEDHDKRYELYCRIHECACCVQCIKDIHKDCRDLSPLSDVLGVMKRSARLSHVERDLRDLADYFKEVENYVSERANSIDVEKARCIDEIQHTRRSINDHLDKIEKQFRNDLSSEHTKIKSKLDTLTSRVKNKKKQLDHLNKDCDKMKQFATDLQILVCLKSIEKTTAEETKYLLDLTEKGELNETHLELNIASPLKAIMSDVRSFGNIAVKRTPSSLQLTVGREAPAQTPVPIETSFEHIKPKLLRILKMPPESDRNIRDCQILPDGQMLFVDRNNKCLMLFSKDGVYSRDVVKFKTSPWGVCYVKDSMVAVTLYDAKHVSFIDVTTNSIVNSAKVSNRCYGIDCDGEIIVLNLSHGNFEAFCIMDLDGNIMCRVKNKSELSTCISLFAKNIYTADFKKGTISCHRINGDLLWSSKLGNMYNIRGLSIDRHGFVYAACRESKQVIVISQDGKQSRVILSPDDGIEELFAVHIDRKTSSLLVCNRTNGAAFLFQI